MAPTKLPFIPDGGSSEYELVVRIYDPLQDFTEYSVPIEVSMLAEYYKTVKFSVLHAITCKDTNRNKINQKEKKTAHGCSDSLYL